MRHCATSLGCHVLHIVACLHKQNRAKYSNTSQMKVIFSRSSWRYFRSVLFLFVVLFSISLLPETARLFDTYLTNSPASIVSHGGHTVELPSFHTFAPLDNQMYYVDTGERTFFKGRECCAIESAAINSKLPQIVVVMTSKTLQLDQSNCTKNLYEKYDNIKFFHSTFKDLFRDLPIEGVENRYDPTMKWAKTKISNFLRTALLFKYGGFYCDLDVITLRPLTGLRNFLQLETDQPQLVLHK